MAVCMPRAGMATKDTLPLLCTQPHSSPSCAAASTLQLAHCWGASAWASSSVVPLRCRSA